MNKLQRRHQILFWIVLILGLIGLLDFLTRGFATQIFNETHPGLNLQSVGIVSGLLFDWTLGIPKLAAGMMVFGIILGDLWWLFLLAAYSIHKLNKRDSVAPSGIQKI